MLLAEVVKRVAGAQLQGSGAVDVRGVSHDSRAVKPGDLFACLVGARFDGHAYAADAVARGAVALCVERSLQSVPVPAILVANSRHALPLVSAEVYGHPSRALKMVGVTGTNGKTTSALLIASILRTAGLSTGTIGTLGAELMGQPLDSERTTPEADQLQSLLAQMAVRGAEAVAMEVSSHALDQRRTGSTEFDAAIFTNLTQDHLDYHGDMESYFGAKLRLFTDYPAASAKPFAAAINLDDPYGRRLAELSAGRVLGYAVEAAAEVRAHDVHIEPGSLSFRADTPAGQLDARLSIGGAFQVYNALGAIAAAVGLGIDCRAIEAGLSALSAAPGRFEAVPTGRGFHVVVDYAHTPDGVKNLLEAARRLGPARVLIVFGCGGDRDRTKRPIMGHLAGELADIAIVTSDNPRTEEPEAIIDEIMPGLEGASARVVVEPDRRAAIAAALAEARDGDLVLIAGKGHEDYQEIHGVKHHFDDREVVRELLGAA